MVKTGLRIAACIPIDTVAQGGRECLCVAGATLGGDGTERESGGVPYGDGWEVVSGWVKWGGGEILVGDGMSGILCIAQPARPGLIPLPAPGGGVGRRGGIRWHGVERGVDCL